VQRAEVSRDAGVCVCVCVCVCVFVCACACVCVCMCHAHGQRAEMGAGGSPPTGFFHKGCMSAFMGADALSTGDAARIQGACAAIMWGWHAPGCRCVPGLPQCPCAARG
jgi:hypothetical protein